MKKKIAKKKQSNNIQTKNTGRKNITCFAGFTNSKQAFHNKKKTKKCSDFVELLFFCFFFKNRKTMKKLNTKKANKSHKKGTNTKCFFHTKNTIKPNKTKPICFFIFLQKKKSPHPQNKLLNKKKTKIKQIEKNKIKYLINSKQTQITFVFLIFYLFFFIKCNLCLKKKNKKKDCCV